MPKEVRRFFFSKSVKFRLSGAFWAVDFDLIFSNILVRICTFLCQRAGHKILEDWSESFVVNEADATMMYNYLYGAVAESIICQPQSGTR